MGHPLISKDWIWDRPLWPKPNKRRTISARHTCAKRLTHLDMIQSRGLHCKTSRGPALRVLGGISQPASLQPKRRNQSASQQPVAESASQPRRCPAESVSQPRGNRGGGISQPAKEMPGGISQPAKETPGGISQPAKETPGGISQPASNGEPERERERERERHEDATLRSFRASQLQPEDTKTRS